MPHWTWEYTTKELELFAALPESLRRVLQQDMTLTPDVIEAAYPDITIADYSSGIPSWL